MFFYKKYGIIISNNSKLSLSISMIQINNLGEINEKNISGRR